MPAPFGVVANRYRPIGLIGHIVRFINNAFFEA
jgi:hypothetical protein